MMVDYRKELITGSVNKKRAMLRTSKKNVSKLAIIWYDRRTCVVALISWSVVVESKNNHGVLPPLGFESQIIASYQQQVVRGTNIASLGSFLYILEWGTTTPFCFAYYY